MQNKPPITAPPNHVAIIMDGNNRWAKERRLPGLSGHKAGVDSVRAVIKGCGENNVKALTLFAFSSENWRRPEVEVNGLMDLFMWALDREVKRLNKYDIKLTVIGDKSRFSESLQKKIRNAEEKTANNKGLALNIAANYGGRWDITQAAQRVSELCVAGELKPEDITEDILGQHISLADLPEPDLCIRTAGEQRISNFLIWQFAYTEFYYADCYWPDFDQEKLEEAFQSFGKRERRFGRTSEQLEADKSG